MLAVTDVSALVTGTEETERKSSARVWNMAEVKRFSELLLIPRNKLMAMQAVTAAETGNVTMAIALAQ